MGAEPRGGDQGMGLEGRVMSPTTRLYGRGCRGPERDTTGSRSHSIRVVSSEYLRLL